MLTEISRWFESIGVHPVLGGAIAGALLMLLLRALMSRRDPADDTGSRQALKPAGRVALNNPGPEFGESGIRIKRNGEDVVLPAEVSARILQLVRDNRKIEAIKVLRSASGLELYDAKQLVDSLEKR